MLELTIAVVSIPFRAWCIWRHKRRYWVVDGPGWGWICQRDGLGFAFSAEDVRDLTARYAEAGKRAAEELLK